MKFVQSPMQTRLFRLPPHYQSLKSRGEQDPELWKEIATALVDQKYNTEIARNSYPIVMFQGGPPHEPYFIAINNREQIIIGPSKKNSGYIYGRRIGGLNLIHENMNAKNRGIVTINAFWIQHGLRQRVMMT